MHAIAFGKRLFGRVDKVPGRYHVATLCFHFCYLPLVPLATYLVATQSMSGMTTDFEGVRIPFSVKSWLIAWSRTLLWFPFILMCFMTFHLFVPDESDPPKSLAEKQAVLAIVAGIALLLFGPYFVPGIGRATRARAAQLDSFAVGQAVDRTVRTVHW